jgi:hypothetical protein
MRNTTTVSIVMLAAAIGLTLAPTLHAQDAPSAAAPQAPSTPDHGPMMNHDMRGMTKMMHECSRMMQSRNDRPAEKSPDQPTK